MLRPVPRACRIGGLKSVIGSGWKGEGEMAFRFKLDRGGQRMLPGLAGSVLTGSVLAGSMLAGLLPSEAARAFPAVPGIAADMPFSGLYDFAALYGRDSPLGSHRVTVTPQADGSIAVDVQIEFKVKLAFVTAFHYHHVDHELWCDGRLLSMDSTTDDDGAHDWVHGHATPDGFLVESSRGSVLAPADILTTTYWNPALLQAPRLLDSVRGVVMDVAVDKVAEETVPAADGGRIAATHYLLHLLSNAPLRTNKVDLWYDGSSHWVKLAFDARGHHVDYQASAPPPATRTQVAHALPREGEPGAGDGVMVAHP